MAYEEMEVQLHTGILTLVIDRSEWSDSWHGCFTPWGKGAHITGGCVDLRSHPDSMDNRKPLSPAIPIIRSLA